jgi:hypothetical protein
LEKSCSNRGSAKCCRPEGAAPRRHARPCATPHARAPSESAPVRRLMPRCPWSRAALGQCAFPQASNTPLDASVLPHHAPPRRRAVRALCTRWTVAPSAVRRYACQPRSAVARRHLGCRHPAITTGRAPPYLRRPPSPRARTAAPPHHNGRRLGELLPAPVHKAVHTAHAFLVTYCNSPSHALRCPRRRLAGSGRCRPTPPTELVGAASAQTSGTPAP